MSKDKLIKRKLREEAMGGVSAPMSTLNNTPGMGNAQPADSAATTGADMTGQNVVGSGDTWGSKPGTYTQDNSSKKKKKKKASRKKSTSTKKKSNKKKPGPKKKKSSKKNENANVIKIKKFEDYDI